MEMQWPRLLATRLGPSWRFRFRFRVVVVCTRPTQVHAGNRVTEPADLTHDIGVDVAEVVAESPRPRRTD